MKLTLPPKLKAWLVDAGERVGSSFAEAVLAAVLAGALAKGVNASTVHVLLIAGLTAAGSTLKAIIAPLVKRSVSPASLAPASASTGTASPATVVRTVILPEQPSKKGGRLGRHIHHDERSRAYAITPADTSTLQSVQHVRHVKPFDQGNLGSCTGNAMAGALSTAPFKHRFTEVRAVDLYEMATRLDNVPGTYPPDDTGSDGLAVAQAAQKAGYITSHQHCFSLAAVLTALQTGPVIAGTNWYSGMDSPDRTGLVHVTGTIRGGHEYELVGCDMAAQQIIACNSWGTSWGAAGYFRISFADFERLLAEQGDVTVPVA